MALGNEKKSRAEIQAEREAAEKVAANASKTNAKAYTQV